MVLPLKEKENSFFNSRSDKSTNKARIRLDLLSVSFSRKLTTIVVTIRVELKRIPRDAATIVKLAPSSRDQTPT